MGGSARGFDQTGGTGVDADYQRFRVRSREGGDCPTVACAQVKDRPPRATDQLVELADVELAQLMANDHAHGTWIITH